MRERVRYWMFCVNVVVAHLLFRLQVSRYCLVSDLLQLADGINYTLTGKHRAWAWNYSVYEVRRLERVLEKWERTEGRRHG